MIVKKDIPIAVIFGSVFPLTSALFAIIFWFYVDKSENHVIMYLISGLLIGLIIDGRYLRRWIRQKYALPLKFVGLVFFLYNVLVYGFFMGFPVFNVFLSTFLGWYIGNRIFYTRQYSSNQHRLTNQAVWLSVLTLLSLCVVSGYLALMGNSVAGEVRSMLGLGFEVTRPMLIGLIVIGGLMLLALQIVIIRFMIYIRLKKLTSAYIS